MKMVKIIEINGYIYNLQDEDLNKYIMNLEFLDIEKQPTIEEYIYISEELLNPKYEGYSTNYTFGKLENKYGKEDITIDDKDVIKLVVENKEIYLKRLYG